MVDPLGACPCGLTLCTWSPNRLPKSPCCTWTWNPSDCSVCCASWQFWPCTSGTGTIGGPFDTDTLTVCPGGGWYLTSGRYASVPAVSKLTAAQAAQTLRGAGFHVRTGPAVIDDNVPKGEVISTSPSGRALPGATIELTLSSGPGKAAIPDVQGRDCQQAQQTLRQAGFNVTMQLGLFGNTITRMSPTGQAPIGTTITLECGS